MNAKIVLIVIVVFLCGCEEKSMPIIESGSSNEEDPKVFWEMSSSFPASRDIFFGAVKDFCDRVYELSDGKFIIKPFPIGTLVTTPNELMEAVSVGSIDMAQVVSLYFVGSEPALIFESGIPFGMTARQHSAWIHEGGGRILIQELLSERNIKYLPGGNTGEQMGGFWKKEVNSLEDFKGVRMRLPGVGGEIMRRLGLVVVDIDGDIVTNLERGNIDAAEYLGPYDDYNQGFHKHAKYYYSPGWWERGTSIPFYINNEKWERLPEKYKLILELVAQETSVKMLAKYDVKNSEYLQKLNSAGVELRRFNNQILEDAKKETTNYFETKSNQSVRYQNLYQNYTKFKDETSEWFELNNL